MKKTLLVLVGCVCFVFAFMLVGGCRLFFTPEVELKDLAKEVEKNNNLPTGTVEIEVKSVIKWVIVEVKFKTSPGKYNAAHLTKENINKHLELQGKKWRGAFALELSVPGGDLSDFFSSAQKYSYQSWQNVCVKKDGSEPLVYNGKTQISVPRFCMEDWTVEDMMNFKTAFRGTWKEQHEKTYSLMHNLIVVKCDVVDWSAIAAYPRDVEWRFEDVDSFINSKNVVPDLKECAFEKCKDVKFPKGIRCANMRFCGKNDKASYVSFMENVDSDSLQDFTFNMKYSKFEDLRRFSNLKNFWLKNVKDGVDWKVVAEMSKDGNVCFDDSHITVTDVEQWAAEKKFNGMFLRHCDVDSDARRKIEEIGAKCFGNWSGFMNITKKN